MKQAIIFLVIFLSSSQRLVDCDVYVNMDNEVLVIDRNKISYRLRNKGGIITYSYFSGHYKKRKKKYKLGADQYSYTDIQSTTDLRSSEEGVRMCFYNQNQKPLQYTPIVFEPSENIFHREYYVEESGCINVFVNLSIDSFDSQFNVQLLGNTFTQNLRVKKGEKYSITLKVPPKYGIQNEEDYKRRYLKIESIDQNQVRVYDSIIKEWRIFEKSDDAIQCHDFIFLE